MPHIIIARLVDTRPATTIHESCYVAILVYNNYLEMSSPCSNDREWSCFRISFTLFSTWLKSTFMIYISTMVIVTIMASYRLMYTFLQTACTQSTSVRKIYVSILYHELQDLHCRGPHTSAAVDTAYIKTALSSIKAQGPKSTIDIEI